MMSFQRDPRGRWLRGWHVVLLILLSTVIVVAIACERAAAPTIYDSPTTSGSSGYVLGTTSSPIFATTAPPPPAPTPDPEPDPDPTPVDDGKERMRGIVLAVDQTCPGCTITTRRGRAFVPESADLLEGGPGDASPITFDQLNAALAPGVPVRIVAQETSGSDPVALSVRVERFFAVSGTIDISSAELESRRQFSLSFDSLAGPLVLEFVLGPGDDGRFDIAVGHLLAVANDHAASSPVLSWILSTDRS